MRVLRPAYAPSTPQCPRESVPLLETLTVIDVEGWDGPAASGLLEFIRTDLVRPLVLGANLRGPAAAQAEATGWEAAWEALAGPSLRTASSPWGVLWTAVRRAVFGEVLTARYHVSPRQAWTLRARHGAGGQSPPPSLGRWVDVDEDTPTSAASPATIAAVRAAVRAACDLLVDAGWESEVIEDLIARLLEDAGPNVVGDGRQLQGWRRLAAETGVAPWQVRRVQALLYGTPEWAGLFERLLREDDLDDDPGMDAALRSTLVGSRLSPATEARNAGRRVAAALARAS